MNDARFVYIDYGGSPLIARELRYSLATLRAEWPDARVVVYTDRPETYAGAPATPRPFGDDLARWTLGGAYNHRAKPCVLLDALRTFGGLCVLLDTDSYIDEGFADALARALRGGAAMDRFERRDPYPEFAGFSADLPHAGRYVYDGAAAAMFNSGLVAARDAACVEDAVALIDALRDAGLTRFNIEQIAFAEAFRLHGLTIGEAQPAFFHYCQRSLKRYMHWRLRGFEARPFAPARPFVGHPRNAVRAFNWFNRIGRWYE